jgi:hypothetical protein
MSLGIWRPFAVASKLMDKTGDLTELGNAAPADIAHRNAHALDASTSHVFPATRVARTWAVSTITERASRHISVTALTSLTS